MKRDGLMETAAQNESTSYARLQQRLEELRGERTALRHEAEDGEQRASAALVAGGGPPVERYDYAGDLRAIDRAIGEVERQLQDPGVVREHVAQRTAAIDRRRQKLVLERQVLERELADAHEVVNRVQGRLDTLSISLEGEFRALAREQGALQALSEDADRRAGVAEPGPQGSFSSRAAAPAPTRGAEISGNTVTVTRAPETASKVPAGGAFGAA